MFAFRFLPTDLVDRIHRWPELGVRARRELGQSLRRMGFTYNEIAALLPVGKGTLSGWCRDLELTREEASRLNARQTQLILDGRRLKKRKHIAWDRAETIRAAAREETPRLLSDAFWSAGAVAYWAEGAKRSKELSFSNSDAPMVQLFIDWCEKYLDVSRDRFTIRLHLHSGQDEEAVREYWSRALGLPLDQFRKAFIKPEGTGHRTNVLYMGTAQVRVCRSTALLHRVKGWIDGLCDAFTPSG